MVGKKRNFKERVLAFVLAMLIIMTGVFPVAGVTADAAVNNENEIALVADEEDNATDESVDEYVDANVTPPPTSGETTEEETPEIKTITVKYKIADKSGNALSNCKVVLKEANSDAEALTGEPVDGVYEVKGVKPGALYAFSVEKSGYGSKSENLLYGTESDGNTTTIIIAPTAVEVDTESLDLKVGETDKFVTVNNTISETDKYNWSVGDEAVVGLVKATTVDTEGNPIEKYQIVAKAEGTTTITVKYGEDGEPVTIPVKVSKNSVTGLSLAKNDVYSGGKNKKLVEVKLTANGLPQDATGTVTFYMKKKNGEIVKSTVNVSTGSAVWSYEDNSGIRGDILFDAEYSGDEKYNAVDAGEINDLSLVHRQSEDLTFAENVSDEIEVILGEVKDLKVPIEDEFKRNLTFISNNTNVVTVDKSTGAIETVGAGKATITILAEKNDEYEEATAKYTVTVKEKIDVTTLDTTSWSPVSKTYDATAVVQMKANLSNTISIEGEDAISSIRMDVTASIVDDVNVGNDKKVKLTNEAKIIGKIVDVTEAGTVEREIDITEYYVLENLENTYVDGKVGITQRTVYLGTKDWNFNVYYRQDLSYLRGALLELVVPVDLSDIYPNSGVVSDGEIEFETMPIDIKSDVNKVFDVGTHPNEFIPKMDGIADTQNYHFVSIYELSKEDNGIIIPNEAINAYLGDLNIIREEISIKTLHSLVTFTVDVTSDGKLYLENEESSDIWISDGILKASIASEQQKYYDQIILKIGGKDVDLCKEGYDVSELETTEYQGEIYLASSGEGRELNATKAIAFNIHVDKTNPTFEFGQWHEETMTVGKFTQAITFNKYKNNAYSIEGVEPTDADSGIQKWEYNVHSVKGDDEVTSEAIAEYIESSDCKWTLGTEDNKIPVVSGTDISIEEAQGNYIVLVKVTDNVGNSAVYTTNGIIIEVEDPSLEIWTTDYKEIVSDKPYSKALPYMIKVGDTGTVSGLVSATIELYNGNEVVRTQTVQFSEMKNEEAEAINQSKEDYTLEEIKELSKYRFIKLDDQGNAFVADIESNNLRIEVTVYDQAGNDYTVSKNLMLDTTDPTVAVRFDYADAEHGHYFKTVKEMTIVYTEKNFDKEKLTFDIFAGANYSENAIVKNVPLNQLSGDEYGIDWEWVTDENTKNGDSQYDKDASTYTNERTHTLKLKFNEDKEYYIRPHCVDMSGRTGSGDAKFFVIDTTPPIVKITYDSDNKDITNAVDSTVYGSRVDMQKQVNAYVSIEEKNFGNINEVRPEEDQISFDGSAVQKKALEATSVEALEAEALSKWGANGNSYNKTFAFLNDAAYTFAFSYKDLAGNPCTYVVGETEYVNKGKAEEELYKYVRSFTVDETKPTGTVVIDKKDSVWDTIVSAVTFNIFKNTDYTVDVTAYDATSGVKYAGYYIAKTDDYQISENTNWIEYARDAEDNYKIDENGNYVDQFNIAPNQQFVVYQKIVDHADNLQYIYPTQGAVADNASQKINLNVTANNSKENNIYNGATVEFNASFEDPIEGDTFSGIKWVYYVVTANNNGINSNDQYWYNFATEKWVTTKTERRNQVQKDEYRIFNENFTINSDTYNCNGVQVQVFAEDFAGNSFQSDPVKVDIDRTQPKIVSVTYNNVQPQNGSYYKDTREAYITIAERNFKKELISIDVKNSDGTPAAISWDVDTNGVSDGTTHTATVTFEHDGDYYFSVNGKDLAGNTMSNPLAKSDTFTIDKQDPKVSVAYDNNSAQNGNYYKAERTATITVTEHNFNGNGMTVTVNGTARSVNWYQAGGDVHKGTVTFATDGDYVFDVECTDLSGRTAANYNEDKFTVDLTNPTVEITGVADKSANKDVVSPAIRIDDTNYSANDVTITLVGAKKGSVDVGSMVSRTNSETGQILSFANFGDDMDDVYTLTAKSMDKAGNETTQSITFSVNRHGSTYAINKDTKKMLDKGYTKEPVSVIIEETNVDTLEFIELSYSKDGKIVKLTEGKDYTVKAEGGEGQWKKYTYTILASCFAEEGKYNINITSVDRAQNESNNKVQSFDVEFVVDKTAPTLAVSNLEDNMRYDTDKHQFVINVKDNTKLSKVELYIDGKLYYTYKGEELTVEDGKVYIDVESNGDEWQTIKLIAYDEADNPTEPLEYRVLVTANGWIQFVNNKPAFYGTIGGLVAAAFIIFFIIWKRKKDQEEKAA